MTTPLRVLILEDSPDDAELMVRELQRAGFEPKWTRVETEADYLAKLDLFVDLILSDFMVPQFDGLAALKLMQEQGFDIPFILVTGSFEELGIACVRQGAADYVIKDKLDRLGKAVIRALGAKQLQVEKQRVEEVLHEREALYRMLFDDSPDPIIVTNRYGRIIELNPAAIRLFEYDLDETPELFERELHLDSEQAQTLMDKIKQNGSVQDYPVRLRSRSGRELDCVASWTVRAGADGAFLGRRGFIRDVSEQVELERALQACRERLRIRGDDGPQAPVGAEPEQPQHDSDQQAEDFRQRLEGLE